VALCCQQLLCQFVEGEWHSIGLAIKKMRSLPLKNEKSDMLMLLLPLCSDAPMMPFDAPQLSLTTVSDLSLTIEESPEETGGGWMGVQSGYDEEE
jgi:hypothetical protein